jgi:hypothetical protein
MSMLAEAVVDDARGHLSVPCEERASAKARLLAFYLPQFHPTPENDEWWGRGFTEWTHVTKAKPLFPGHDQPRVPADLGYYDLRVPETRVAQAELARKAGIEGFCYWHYWFGGRRILERPFNEVLRTGEPDFPFCLAWANHSWHGKKGLLLEQTYPGRSDHEAHFYALLPAFRDPRYVRVQGRPLFYIFSAWDLPDIDCFIELWQRLARENGLEGIHFVARCAFEFERSSPESLSSKLDAFTYSHESRMTSYGIRYLLRRAFWEGRDASIGGVSQRAVARAAMQHAVRRVCSMVTRRPTCVFNYEDALPFLRGKAGGKPKVYPSIVPRWDHSPRSGGRRTILHGSTPALFRRHVREVLDDAQVLPADERIVFVKSWNEWAEGNYLEPDQRYGHQYLDVLREEVLDRPTSDRVPAKHASLLTSSAAH